MRDVDIKKKIEDMKKNKLLSSIIYPEFFEINNNETILNLGCGAGPQVIIYKGQYKKMIGVDVDKDKLDLAEDIARELGIINFGTLHSNVESMDLKDKSFDKIIAIDIVEHVQNPIKFLSETHRLLKDERLMLITFPAMHDRFIDFVSSIATRIFRRKSKKIKKDGWDPTEHQYDYNIKEWKGIIEMGGFKIVKSRASTLFPPLQYYGVSRFWFKNKIIHNIDNFFCKLPMLKNLGQALVCVYRKK